MLPPNATIPGQPESHALMLRGLLSPNGFTGASTTGVGSQGPGGARMPLPLVELFSREGASSSFTATTSIDDRGALTDRSVLKQLRWTPGKPVQITMIPSSGVIVIRPHGTDAITGKGHVRLPARIRHQLRLEAGDRLLLLALVNDDVLLAYAGSAIDRMVTAFHEGITEQEIR